MFKWFEKVKKELSKTKEKIINYWDNNKDEIKDKAKDVILEKIEK